MAKQKSNQQGKSSSTFLLLDEKKVPVTNQINRSAELSHPKEYQLVDSMKVGQSAIFPKEKIGAVNAIKRRLLMTTNKKYIIRKENNEFNRIWRVADNAVIRKGGHAKGYKNKKSDNVQTNNNQQ